MTQEKLSAIAQYMIKRNETIGTAESATAGLLSSSLSLAENATQFFQGGIVAYNLGQKTRHLSIDPIRGEKDNCISEIIAEQMVLGVTNMFCCEWGISVTGYATPVPAIGVEKCFAFFSFAYKGSIIKTQRIETDLKGQSNVQQFFVNQIVQDLAKMV